MEKTILKLDHVSLSLKEKADSFSLKPKKREILRDISFTIKENEIVGLVGESGCGKSTLAQTILGFHKGYTGTIEYEDSLQEHTSQMIFQDPYSSLNPKKTIRFILEEPLKMKGSFTKEEMDEKAKAMLFRVGLGEEYLNRYPSELSGGQRQRICIASALMLAPKLLIADEPVSALDVTIQAQVMELLFSLHKEMGLSILFISHDLRLVYQICDRVIIMRQGCIIENQLVDDIFNRPKEEYTKKLIMDANLY